MREKDQQHCLICLKQCKRAVSSRAEDAEVSQRLQVVQKMKLSVIACTAIPHQTVNEQLHT